MRLIIQGKPMSLEDITEITPVIALNAKEEAELIMAIKGMNTISGGLKMVRGTVLKLESLLDTVSEEKRAEFYREREKYKGMDVDDLRVLDVPNFGYFFAIKYKHLITEEGKLITEIERVYSSLYDTMEEAESVLENFVKKLNKIELESQIKIEI